MSEPSTGVLLVDKPAGCTSHDVVRAVRRRYGQQQVGHTGTLDPAATGLLVLVLGQATRIARFLEASEKGYAGTIRFGQATTTYDAQGDVTREVAVDTVDPTRLHSALEGLTGQVEQQVPPYSAVKVGGERLHTKARRGDVIELPSRTVRVHALSATAMRGAEVDIEAVVSKGTYIRTLAVQIGEALSLPAHLSSLRRLSVGPHRVEDAVALERVAGTNDELISMGRSLRHLPEVVLEDADADDVGHGRRLRARRIEAGLKGQFAAGDAVRFVAADGRLCAVGIAGCSSAALTELDPEDTQAVRYGCVLNTTEPRR